MDKGESGAAPEEKRRRRGLYIVSNALMVMVVAIAFAMNDNAEFGLGMYIVGLFSICTSPLLFLSSFRGKELLVLLFLAVYFDAFCLQDLAGLFSNGPSLSYPRPSLFTQGEAAILLGSLCVLAGYAAASMLVPKRHSGILTREWSPGFSTVLGIGLWVTGFCFIAAFQFGAADLHARVGFDPRIAGFFTLFRMMEPLGMLMLIYQYLITRRKILIPLLLAMMAADVALGFLGDTKELAIRGPLLYLVCQVGLRERLPIIETFVFILFAGVLFNAFAQYRDFLHSRSMTREKAFENIGAVLDRLLRKNEDVGKGLSNGIDYLAERISLKSYVELVIARTGNGVDFQNGKTIQPLLFAFVPRFILPDKEDNAMTGRLFNRKFHLSESDETYIAMGQLGEFYWNFGWPGLVIGMFLVGLFMTVVASLVSLDDAQTLPRFLLLLCTIYLVALRFEDAIALTYTVWARVTVMLLAMHVLMPKKRLPEPGRDPIASVRPQSQ
jgi:hypothetical protein